MYKYCHIHEFFDEEHMLFPKEIAIKYNMFDNNAKPQYVTVSIILKKYIEKNYFRYIRTYYMTKYGPKEVFKKEIYHPAIMEYKKSLEEAKCK